MSGLNTYDNGGFFTLYKVSPFQFISRSWTFFVMPRNSGLQPSSDIGKAAFEAGAVKEIQRYCFGLEKWRSLSPQIRARFTGPAPAGTGSESQLWQEEYYKGRVFFLFLLRVSSWSITVDEYETLSQRGKIDGTWSALLLWANVTWTQVPTNVQLTAVPQQRGLDNKQLSEYKTAFDNAVEDVYKMWDLYRNMMLYAESHAA